MAILDSEAASRCITILASSFDPVRILISGFGSRSKSILSLDLDPASAPDLDPELDIKMDIDSIQIWIDIQI